MSSDKPLKDSMPLERRIQVLLQDCEVCGTVTYQKYLHTIYKEGEATRYTYRCLSKIHEPLIYELQIIKKR